MISLRFYPAGMGADGVVTEGSYERPIEWRASHKIASRTLCGRRGMTSLGESFSLELGACEAGQLTPDADTVDA